MIYLTLITPVPVEPISFFFTFMLCILSFKDCNVVPVHNTSSHWLGSLFVLGVLGQIQCNYQLPKHFHAFKCNSLTLVIFSYRYNRCKRVECGYEVPMLNLILLPLLLVLYRHAYIVMQFFCHRALGFEMTEQVCIALIYTLCVTSLAYILWQCIIFLVF